MVAVLGVGKLAVLLGCMPHYCTVMLSDPLAQVLPDKTDALIVAVPEPTKVAKPFVVVEKVTIESRLLYRHARRPTRAGTTRRGRCGDCNIGSSCQE